jgi:hypothetical protein
MAIALLGGGPSGVARAQQPLLGRPSPPQPQQKQGLEYFAGSWTFSFAGRESPLTAGQRSGTVTYTLGDRELAMVLKGAIDGGGEYQETATLTWDAEKKQLHLRERMGGATLVSVGDWSSPIAITVESQPVTVKGQAVKLRRFYSILSATSFSIVEEISVDGAAYVRIGKGDFVRAG